MIRVLGLYRVTDKGFGGYESSLAVRYREYWQVYEHVQCDQRM